MTQPAATPSPPYVAVIFTSLRTSADGAPSYGSTAARMASLAAEQPGYLGMESAHEDVGITVSYWVDEDAARAWKGVAEHAEAQRIGWERWYAWYRVRVAVVTREYGHGS